MICNKSLIHWKMIYMEKCSLCKKREAIAKIQWIGKQSIDVPFFVCLDCFLRVTAELIRTTTKK